MKAHMRQSEKASSPMLADMLKSFPGLAENPSSVYMAITRIFIALTLQKYFP